MSMGLEGENLRWKPISARRPGDRSEVGDRRVRMNDPHYLQRSVGNKAVSARVPQHCVQRDSLQVVGDVEGNAVRIAVGECRRAREAFVYIPGDGYVYKAFARQDIGRQLWAEMQRAAEGGLPVPRSKCFAATLNRESDRDTPVFVIQSEFIHGRVFYASKPGGVAVFRNRVETIYALDDLRRIRRGLSAATELGLADPQGFVTDDDRLIFFDVHLRGSGLAVADLLDAVDQQIAAVAGLLEESRRAIIGT